MSCTRPVTAWYSKQLNPNGKRSLVFDSSQGIGDAVKIPCGYCIECRIEKSRQWAIRCMHETKLHEENCFLTLTYNDENLPKDGSVHKEHFQSFMKRMRKKYGKMRYFHCGEYGENFGRPHYHAILFGHYPKDAELHSIRNGIRYYKSERLNKTWRKGFVVIGDVTFESAAYVARYVMKKVTGDKAEEHYQGKSPEYITMSRNPGIGKEFFEKYMDEIYKTDSVISKGQHAPVPKYYDYLMEKIDSNFIEETKRKRRKAHEERNITVDNIYARHVQLKQNIKKLRRPLENENLHDI